MDHQLAGLSAGFSPATLMNMPNKLALPPLLVELCQQNRWKHPGDDVIQSLIPYIKEPVHFITCEHLRPLPTPDIIADDLTLRPVFHITRGSEENRFVELPWIDAELTIFIADNRIPGDDVAIALDFRTDLQDPRVVASDWWTLENQGCIWREVAPTFSEFVAQLSL